jgi:hypothetical protein
MNIQLMSDLHLEVDPAFRPLPAPGADLLVLAGDIGARPESPMGRFGSTDWSLTRFSPRLGHWPVPVLYLPGNHEYDGLEFDECRAKLRQTCAGLGIHWLDESEYRQGDVRILGTTLWSDFDAFADRPAHIPGSMSYNLREREKAFHAANFYLERTRTRRHGRLFDAAAMREESLRAQQWLAAKLAEPHAGKTVVVSHFAPSLRSHDPRYGLTPGTAGFCSALEHLTEGVDLWLHGHLHCPSDYTIGGCRVVANPLGYLGTGEQAGFNPTLCLQI